MTRQRREKSTKKRASRKTLSLTEELSFLPKAIVMGAVVLVLSLVVAPTMKLSGKINDRQLEQEERRIRRKAAKKKA